MPSDKFPGPNYNRLIETDPQIVKIPLDKLDWGSRMSAQPSGSKAPSAPEMGIKHVSGKNS